MDALPRGEEFAALVDVTDELLFVVQDGRTLYANRAAAEALQIPRSALTDRLFIALVDAADRPAVQRAIRAALDGAPSRPVPACLSSADGDLFCGELVARPVRWQGSVAAAVVCHDVADRQLVEEALRETRERFDILQEAAPIVICRLDRDGNLLYANRRFEDLTGYSRSEALGRRWADLALADPETAARLDTWLQAMLDGRPPAATEWQLVRKDGTAVWVTGIGSVQAGGNGGGGVQLFIQDVGEHRRATEAVRILEIEKTTLLDSISDHAAFMDAEFRVRWANSAATANNLQPDVGLIGQRCFSAWLGRSEPCDGCPVRSTLHSGRPESAEIKTDDGRVLLVRAYPTHDADGNIRGAVEVMQDITDSRHLEAELQRAHELESIGLLAGGIAHDFNNLLAGILGNIALAKLHAGNARRVSSYLRSADEAVGRAKGLVQQLLTFARGGAPVAEVTDIGELLREITEFSLRGSNVAATFRVARDLRAARVDPAQVGQLIQNLVINAMQAMPDGGHVHLNAVNDRLEGHTALADGDYLRVTVRDTGIGIDEQDLARIFDPYFSTKPKGVGLGLATAYSITKSHGGHIAVQSELGIGTTFTVHLPATDEPLEAEPQTAPEPGVGRGRILVMDDEQLVREVVVGMLQHLGYDAVAVAEGAVAVRAYREALEQGERFDAVVMDLTVPGGMGGDRALAEIQAFDPEVRGIVSSGYSSDPIMAAYRDYGFCGVVAKPYDLDGLARVLDDVLDDD